MSNSICLPQARAKIGVVVVSFNRRQLLEECLQALIHQSSPVDKILVVDNGSTDGTQEWLSGSEWAENPLVELVVLPENKGGAGGFHAGMAKLIAENFDWIWMMDDDACPSQDALLKLIEIADDTRNVYGSLAVEGTCTSWATALLDEGGRIAKNAQDVPARARVQSLPFLGFLVHRTLIESIGLPDPGFFIAADDVEYCLRASRNGADIVIAGESLIEHPKANTYEATLIGRRFIFLRLPPWKRYYDTRNRLLIAKKYYGYRWITQTVPGSFLRLAVALIYEPRKGAQAWAFFAGFADGLFGFKGRRHEHWRISL